MSRLPFFYFFYLENRAMYEVMLKNIVQIDMPQMTVCHVRITCSITKARTCFKVTLYVYLLRVIKLSL